MEIVTVVGACSVRHRPVGIQFAKRDGDYIAGGSFTVQSSGIDDGKGGALNGCFKLSQSFKCKYCGNKALYQCSHCGKFVCYDGMEHKSVICPECGNVADVPATTSARIVCSAKPATKKILIAMDVSESMNESSGSTTRIEETKNAAMNEFVNKFAGNPMAIVTFSTGARVVQKFTEDSDSVRRAINGLRAEGGTTSPFAEICEAFPEFINGNSGEERVIVVFTDGAWSGKEEGHIARAKKIRESGVKIVAIGCAGAKSRFLKEIATPGYDISASDGSIGVAFAAAAEKLSQ